MADLAMRHRATLPLPVDVETMRRLHGHACLVCGATGPLTPAGHAYTTDATPAVGSAGP